jgi:hypothetical protein
MQTYLRSSFYFTIYQSNATFCNWLEKGTGKTTLLREIINHT